MAILRLALIFMCVLEESMRLGFDRMIDVRKGGTTAAVDKEVFCPC